MRLVTDKDSVDYTTDISESNLVDRILIREAAIMSSPYFMSRQILTFMMPVSKDATQISAHFGLKCATEKICTKKAKK